jgi:hypothetical protein
MFLAVAGDEWAEDAPHTAVVQLAQSTERNARGSK